MANGNGKPPVSPELSEARRLAGLKGAQSRWGNRMESKRFEAKTMSHRLSDGRKTPGLGASAAPGYGGQAVVPSVPGGLVNQPDTGNTLIDVDEAQDTAKLPRSAFDSVGARGIANWGGTQLPEPNTKLQLTLAYGTPGNQVWGEWEKLARTNPAAAAALEMVCASIRDARVEIEPNEENPDQKLAQVQADFLSDNCLNWLEPQWPETMYQTAWGMLVFGHKISEVVWDVREDKRVPGGKAFWVKKLADRLPSTVRPDGWMEKDDELAVIRQQGQRNGRWYGEIDLPANKVLLWSWGRMANNYQGFSALRPVWYLGQIYTELQKILAIGHQRETLGVPVIEVDKDARLTDDQWKRLQKLAQNMTYHENAGAALPAGVSMNWVTSGSNRGGKSHLLQTMQEIKLTIFEVFMTQQAALGTGNTGSRSVGTVHQAQKTAFVQGVLTNVEAVLNGVGERPYTGLVGKILRPNWGKVDFPPKIRLTLEQSELSPTDFGQALLYAVQAGAITITADDENTVREKLGLAPIDDATRDEARAKAAALLPPPNPPPGQAPPPGAPGTTPPNGAPPNGQQPAGATPPPGAKPPRIGPDGKAPTQDKSQAPAKDGKPPASKDAGKDGKAPPKKVAANEVPTHFALGDTVFDIVADEDERPDFIDDAQYDRELLVLQERIGQAQRNLAGSSLMAIWEGRDAAGKSSSIERIMAGMDDKRLQHEHVTAPLYPEEEKVMRDLSWYENYVPGPGTVTLFDRSYYSGVFGVHVNAPDSLDWKARYEEINAFEKKIADAGTVILKFYCEISKPEQRRRLLDRKNDPAKRHKLKPADWRAHWQYDAYTPVIEEGLTNTDTPWARWTLVDMEDKHRGRLRMMELLCHTLEELARRPAPTKTRFASIGGAAPDGATADPRLTVMDAAEPAAAVELANPYHAPKSGEFTKKGHGHKVKTKQPGEKKQKAPRKAKGHVPRPAKERRPKKLAEWQPNRALRPAERVLALREMSDYLDNAPEAFENGAKPLLLEMVAKALPHVKAAKGHPKVVASLQLDDSRLRDFVRKFIGDVATYGYNQVAAERKKALAGRGKVKLASEEEKDGRTPDEKTKDFEDAAADSTTKRIRQRVQAQLEREAIDVDRTDGDEDEIVSEVVADILDSGALLKDASSFLTKAWNMGRDQFARERGDEVSSVELSAILDRNTCDYCEEHDGDEFDFNSDEHDAMTPPLRDCAGQDLCRCLIIYNFKTSGGEDDEGDGEEDEA